jgi:pSer/pThr/pTyr-binding forkhead associated (FHA) protein
MPITVIIRSRAGEETARLTFDAAQRVVIGRGSGSDIRLPESTVSHRHAILRAQGSDFVVVDEASMNGTFVGDVRVAPRTSRIIRSGSTIRIGRFVLEVLIDQNPVTRDLALATRDLALALVSRAMEEIGDDPTIRVRVVEGPDQGTVFRLAEEGRSYIVGRGPHCDLPVADADASREHFHLIRREGGVFLRDRGAKNGTWLGEARLAPEQEVHWRAAQMVRLGTTVLALEEPVSEALARIERAPDEPLADAVAAGAPPPENVVVPGQAQSPAAAEENGQGAVGAAPVVAVAPRAQARWSLADGLVVSVALVILILSLAGMVWLLHG